MTVRVLGVDACKGGWIGLANDGRAYGCGTISELVETAALDGALGVVAIDIPIGLPLDGTREADVLTRTAVGARRSSVFTTPIRGAVLAATHAEATALSVQVTGKGVSQQAYALRTKILEVDDWMRSTSITVIEVHPELSFATMAARPLAHPKSTWSGFAERVTILRGVGIEIPAELGSAGHRAAVDDVLDAAAACWSAARYAAGSASSLPEVPEDLGDGGRTAIWA